MLFNLCEHTINPDGINADGKKEHLQKIKINFNVLNGYFYEVNSKDDEKTIISKDFAVDILFYCSCSEYFFEAIRLCYQVYYLLNNSMQSVPLPNLLIFN